MSSPRHGVSTGADRQRPKHTKTVFVSYSRTNFYFAAAAADTLRLQTSLEPWFDVERLKPGMDWAATLDGGLDNSDALLLLASPEALASDYVRHEWTRALELGIPIYVGVVEAVDLPPELVSSPVHDLRTRWRERAFELSDAIARGHTEPTLPAPRPNRLGIPVAMPASVATLLALSLLTSVTLAGATALLIGLSVEIIRLAWDPSTSRFPMAPNEGVALDVLRMRRWHSFMFLSLGLSAAMIPLAPWVLTSGARLFRRRIGQADLASSFVTAAGTGSAVILILALIPVLDARILGTEVTALFFPYPPEVISLSMALAASMAGVIVLSTSGMMVTLGSRTLQLWIPITSDTTYYHAPATRHSNILQRPVVRWKKFRAKLSAIAEVDLSDVPSEFDKAFLAECVLALQEHSGDLTVVEGEPLATFEVLCLAPADSTAAKHIEWVCRRAGVAAESSPGRWVLVLVSSQVPWQETKRAIIQLGSRAVCVLVDTVRLPSDAEELRRYQWFDFRERVPDRLVQLLSDLRSPASTRESPPQPPIATDRLLIPGQVRQFATGAQIFPAFLLGFTLVSALLRPWEIQSTVLTAITIPLVFCLTLLGIRVAQRRVTARQVSRRSTAISALLSLWFAVAISVLWIPAPQAASADTYAPTPANGMPVMNTVLLVLLWTMILLLIIGLLALFSRTIRTMWLPPEVANFRPSGLSTGMRVYMWAYPVAAAPGIVISFSLETLVALAL
jgi:hypothetical protein